MVAGTLRVKPKVALIDDDVLVVRAYEFRDMLKTRNQKQLAEDLGISESSLSRFLKRNGYRREVDYRVSQSAVDTPVNSPDPASEGR